MRLPARVHEADGKGHLEHQLPTRDLQATRLVLGFGQENLRWVAERHLGHLGHAFLGQVARALSEWRTLAHDVGALVPEPRGGRTRSSTRPGAVRSWPPAWSNRSALASGCWRARLGERI
ncbi:hypothetical protein EFN22_11280 [Propionibacterium freudenreichii]|nr:hypothetical protein [Propionibacterium freudenreichii]